MRIADFKLRKHHKAAKKWRRCTVQALLLNLDNGTVAIAHCKKCVHRMEIGRLYLCSILISATAFNLNSISEQEYWFVCIKSEFYTHSIIQYNTGLKNRILFYFIKPTMRHPHLLQHRDQRFPNQTADNSYQSSGRKTLHPHLWQFPPIQSHIAWPVLVTQPLALTRH